MATDDEDEDETFTDGRAARHLRRTRNGKQGRSLCDFFILQASRRSAACETQRMRATIKDHMAMGVLHSSRRRFGGGVATGGSRSLRPSSSRVRARASA